MPGDNLLFVRLTIPCISLELIADKATPLAHAFARKLQDY